MSRWRPPWLHRRTAWPSEQGASRSCLSAKSGDANRSDRSPSCATAGPPLWPDRSTAIGHEQCDHRKALWPFLPWIRALMQTYGKCGSRLCGRNGLDAALMTARSLLNGIGLFGERQVAARERRKAAAQSVHRASAAGYSEAVVHDRKLNVWLRREVPYFLRELASSLLMFKCGWNSGSRRSQLSTLSISGRQNLCSLHQCSKMAVAVDCLSRATLGKTDHVPEPATCPLSRCRKLRFSWSRIKRVQGRRRGIV